MSESTGIEQRLRRRSLLSWILVAVLGAATITSMVSIVHDQVRIRLALDDMVQTAADGVAERASAVFTAGALKVPTSEAEAGSLAHRLVGGAFAARPGRRAEREPLLIIGDEDVIVTDDRGRVVSGDAERSSGRLRASAPIAILPGWNVTIAVPNARVHASPLLAIAARQRIQLGLWLLSTLVVLVLAFTASRHEVRLLRMRSDFVAGVSHELRMPLATLILAGETLRVDPEGERTRQDIGTIVLRESRRLASVIENVLLFSRANAVPFRPVIEVVPVDALFDDVCEAVQLVVENARQSLQVDAATRDVLGDRVLLRQALVNLVDNAVKYGPAGQTIRLSAWTEDSCTVLAVDDHGPGIPASDRRMAMKPYARLARDRESVRAGSGLGLAVTREIASICGGSLVLDDPPNHAGTRAMLRMRAAPASFRAASAEG